MLKLDYLFKFREYKYSFQPYNFSSFYLGVPAVIYLTFNASIKRKVNDMLPFSSRKTTTVIQISKASTMVSIR